MRSIIRPIVLWCAAGVSAAGVAAAEDADIAATTVAEGQPPVRFTTEARWEIAGYNNEEIVYTIVVTNQDSRIIRCTTSIAGSYFEDGKKLGIADRQSSTVFPDQQVQVGNWMGMDQKSGARYTVKCRPV